MDGEEEEEDSLVEEREEEMVTFTGSNEPPIKRKAWFLITSSSSIHESLTPPFAPSHYKANSPIIQNARKVLFKGWVNPQRQWGQWVDKLKPTYKDLWKKVGIFDAIKVSAYRIKRDPSSIFGVVGFWCEETNTFLFPWSEATVTLEDVMVLGGFSVIGDPIRANGPLEGELGEIESKMVGEHRKFNRSKCKKADHSLWTRHYMEEGEGDELEHIAFLSLWLSRFVFPGPPLNIVRRCMIATAVRLARGARIALAPAVLASLYRDLRVLKDYLAGNGSREASPLVVCAPFNILQLWVWERFFAQSPESNNFVNSDEPRAARWQNVRKKLKFSFAMSVLELPDEFQWRPYHHWCKPFFDKDDGEWVCGNAVADEGLGSFARCLRACELVGLDCIEQYLPHRVARQFGLDQDITNYVPRANSTWEVAWETYDISAKNVKFYVPPRLFKSDVTLRYSIWWKNVQILLKKKTEGKKRKKTRSLPDSKKKKVQDFYDTTLSDWLSLKNRGISSKSRCVKSHKPTTKTTVIQEQHTRIKNPKKRAKLKLSLKSSETMNQNSEASREVQVEPSPGKEFVSHTLAIEHKEIMGDIKKTNVVESVYDAIVIEKPEEKFKMEESTAAKDKESELEVEIKRLKEEIASIQARVMDLESLAEVHPKPDFVFSIS